MAKRETRTDDRDPTAAVAAVLDAARREAGGIGKSARRKLARLERRISAALNAEAKRRRQFDQARTELADLVGRVAGLVKPTADAPAAESPAPKSAAPKSVATKAAAVKSAATKPATKPAATKPAPKPAASTAKPTAARASATPRRRSLRNARGSAGGPDS